jgi:hypothetical protein
MHGDQIMYINTLTQNIYRGAVSVLNKAPTGVGVSMVQVLHEYDNWVHFRLLKKILKITFSTIISNIKKINKILADNQTEITFG